MNPICKIRNEKKKTIKKISLTQQGFVNLDLHNFASSKNFLDFKNLFNIIEYSFNHKQLELIIKSKNKNLPLKHLLLRKELPLMSLYKNNHNINIRDVIYINNDLYLTKMINFDNDLKINILNSDLKVNEISYLNDSWVFGNSERLLLQRCNYCGEIDQNLIKVCDCQIVHKQCFLEIFSSLTKIETSPNNLEITIKNFYCKDCKCDFEPFYFVEDVYVCFLNIDKNKFTNCFLLIKKNHEIIQERKFVGILFFNLSKKSRFYDKKFSYKLKEEKFVIKGQCKDTFVYSPNTFRIKNKYLKKSFFLLKNFEFHFRKNAYETFFNSVKLIFTSQQKKLVQLPKKKLNHNYNTLDNTF